MAKSQNPDSRGISINPDMLPVLLREKPGEKGGRPPAIGLPELERLRQAYLMGCDDDEAASFAGVHRSTLYRHQKANPEFLDWKNALKQTPFLTARKTIVDHLDRDPEFALRYMERKKKAEFSPQAKLVLEQERPLDDEGAETIGNALMEHMSRMHERKQRQQHNAATSTADQTEER